MIICIDSQIIVWGLKRQATAGQEPMIAKAEAFFKWIDEQKHDVIIPSIVVAEILTPEPPTTRAIVLDIINKHFLVVNFDTKAALKYAELLHQRISDLKGSAADLGIAKERMKMDHVIIASAIVNHANCIYSYDKGLKTFATAYIDVKEFPNLPRTSSIQTQLFGGATDKGGEQNNYIQPLEQDDEEGPF